MCCWSKNKWISMILEVSRPPLLVILCHTLFLKSIVWNKKLVRETLHSGLRGYWNKFQSLFDFHRMNSEYHDCVNRIPAFCQIFCVCNTLFFHSKLVVCHWKWLVFYSWWCFSQEWHSIDANIVSRVSSRIQKYFAWNPKIWGTEPTK